MKFALKIFIINLIFLIKFFTFTLLFADNHNIYETIDQLQKDIKTLEKAVYSRSLELNENVSGTNLDSNSEDVLTRHLLKLSEIENQFQQLTNKFEEINFKLDKLSNRLSKVQADNQIRFQDLENVLSSDESIKKIMITMIKFYQEVHNHKNLVQFPTKILIQMSLLSKHSLLILPQRF